MRSLIVGAIAVLGAIAILSGAQAHIEPYARETRLITATPITNTAHTASETAISCALGGKMSTNPLPLMSCEKLDTQNGISNRRNTVQRSGGGLPGSRTDR